MSRAAVIGEDHQILLVVYHLLQLMLQLRFPVRSVATERWNRDEPFQCNGATTTFSGSHLVVKLRGVGKRLGPYSLNSAYDDEFPEELRASGLVSAADFALQMERFNVVLSDYWPCFFCQSFAYGCSLCTAGLSFLCPKLCMNEAEKMLRERSKLRTRDLSLLMHV